MGYMKQWVYILMEGKAIELRYSYGWLKGQWIQMGRKRAMVWSSEKGNQSLLLYHQKRYRVDRSYSSYTTLAMLPDYRLPWIIPDFYSTHIWSEIASFEKELGYQWCGQNQPTNKNWRDDTAYFGEPVINTTFLQWHFFSNTYILCWCNPFS